MAAPWKNFLVNSGVVIACDPLGRRLDENLVDLGRERAGRLRHCSSSCFLRSASAAAALCVYLLIQRSWIWRIGTALR